MSLACKIWAFISSISVNPLYGWFSLTIRREGIREILGPLLLSYTIHRHKDVCADEECRGEHFCEMMDRAEEGCHQVVWYLTHL